MIREINGECCPNSLGEDFVKRGNYYAGMLGHHVVVYWDSEHGYPIGNSVMLGCRPDQIADLIAVLRAAQDKYL